MSNTLDQRIDAALYRIGQGLPCCRIPADETDPDIVLVACRERIAALEAQLAEAQARAEKAEGERDKYKKALTPVEGLSSLPDTIAKQFADISRLNTRCVDLIQEQAAIVSERDQVVLERDIARQNLTAAEAALREAVELLDEASCAVITAITDDDGLDGARGAALVQKIEDALPRSRALEGK